MCSIDLVALYQPKMRPLSLAVYLLEINETWIDFKLILNVTNNFLKALHGSLVRHWGHHSMLLFIWFASWPSIIVLL